MTQPTPDRSVLEQALETIQFLARVANVSHNECDATGATIAAIRAAIAKTPTPPTYRALVEQLVGALEILLDRSMTNMTDETMATEQSIAEWNAGHAALAAGREALAQTQGEGEASYRSDYPTSAAVLGAEIAKAKEEERRYGVGFLVNGWHVPASTVSCWGMSKATHPQASEPSVQWCKHCGEGVTDFCRSKAGTCAYGFQRPGKASEPAPSTAGDVASGTWEHLKLMMEVSAWDEKVLLSDALANIDEFAALQSAAQPESDPNAPWLTKAHMLCTDNGVPQGNIEWRMEALRGLLSAPAALPAKCVCGETTLGVVHRTDGPCYYPTEPHIAVAALPVGELTDEQIGKAWSVAEGEHNASASVKRRITRAILEAAHKIGGQG